MYMSTVSSLVTVTVTVSGALADQILLGHCSTATFLTLSMFACSLWEQFSWNNNVTLLVEMSDIKPYLININAIQHFTKISIVVNKGLATLHMYLFISIS